MFPRLTALTFALLAIFPLASHATNFNFTGAISSDWNNPANWAQDMVPGVNDDAYISDDKTASLSANTTIANVFLSDYAVLNIAGYTMNVSNALQNNGGILNGGGVVNFSGSGVVLQNYGLIFSNPKTFTLQVTGNGSLDIAGRNSTNTGLIDSAPYQSGYGTESAITIDGPVLPIAGGIGVVGPITFNQPVTMLAGSILSFANDSGYSTQFSVLTAPSITLNGKINPYEGVSTGTITANATINSNAFIGGGVEFSGQTTIDGGTFNGNVWNGFGFSNASVMVNTTFDGAGVGGQLTIEPGVTVNYIYDGVPSFYGVPSASYILENGAQLINSIGPNAFLVAGSAIGGNVTMYDSSSVAGVTFGGSIHVISGTATMSAPFKDQDNGQTVSVAKNAQLVFTNSVSLSTWPNLPTMNFGSGITRFDCGASGLSLYGNFNISLLDLDGTPQNPTTLIVNQAPYQAVVTTLTTNSVDIDDASYDGLMEIGNGATFKLITPSAWTLGPSGSVYLTASLVWKNPVSVLSSSDILAQGTFQSDGFNNQILSNITCAGAIFQVNTGALQAVNHFNIATTATKTGPGNLDISGLQSHAAGSQFIATNGATIFDTDAGAIAPTLSVSASHTGTITFDVRQHIAGLTISGSAYVQPNPYYYGDRLVLTTNNLSISDQGRLDLQDTGIIWNLPAGTDPTSTLQTVRSWIASAYTNGSWTGPGITSSFARKFPYQLTTIAYASAAELEITSYASETLASNSILITGAFIGDANLDDNVDSQDAAIVWNSIENPPAAVDWADGDFNFDGVVDYRDMLLLDRTAITFNNYQIGSSFDMLRTAQFGPDYVPELMAMLPEPSLIIFASIPVCAFRRPRGIRK